MNLAPDPIDRLVAAVGELTNAAQALDAGALADATEILRRTVEELTGGVDLSPESGDHRLIDAASQLAQARDHLLVATELNRRLLRAWSEITGVASFSKGNSMGLHRFGPKGSMQLAW